MSDQRSRRIAEIAAGIKARDDERLRQARDIAGRYANDDDIDADSLFWALHVTLDALDAMMRREGDK